MTMLGEDFESDFPPADKFITVVVGLMGPAWS